MALKLLTVIAFVVVGVSSSYIQALVNRNDISPTEEDKNVVAPEIVRIDLYYETMCFGCKQEYADLPPLVEKLGDYVDLHTYPYGNAKTETANNTTRVECQHGELECYGNKLHACAIRYLKSTLAYINYNACLMAKDSDDDAANECGQALHVDSEPIKKCASGQEGDDLLIYYGQESKKVNYTYVPYTLINNKELTDGTLWDAVCGALKKKPKVCDQSQSDHEAVTI